MADIGAVFRADNSRGDRGIQAERTAERQHPVPYLHPVGITQFCDGQFAINVDFDDGEICIFVCPDEMRIVFAGVTVNRHLNFRGLVDYVVIRENEPFTIEDLAGTKAAVRIGPVIGRVEEAIEKILKWIIQVMRTLRAAFRFFDHLGGGDIDDGRTDFLGDG